MKVLIDTQHKTASIRQLKIYKFKCEISHDEIISLFASINYTTIYFSSGKSLIIAKTLKKFEQELSQHGFIRVHKSAMINPFYITNYSHPEIKLANGQVVKVSRRRKLIKNV